VKRVRVVGWGSPYRGDDQAGLWAAGALRAILPPEVEVRDSVAGGADLDTWCQNVDALVVIDAARATADLPLGAVRRLDYRAERRALRTVRGTGTHGIGLLDALELAERLDLLPREVFVYAIAAERFGPGDRLSEALREPLANLVRSVRSDVLAMLGDETPPVPLGDLGQR
jgi:hydrogenase maturation protease